MTDLVTDIKRTLLSGAAVIGGLDIDVDAMLAADAEQAEVDDALLTIRREPSS